MRKAASEQTRFASMAEAMEKRGHFGGARGTRQRCQFKRWMRAQAKGSVLLAPTPTLLLRLAERGVGLRETILLVGIGNTPRNP